MSDDITGKNDGHFRNSNISIPQLKYLSNKLEN